MAFYAAVFFAEKTTIVKARTMEGGWTEQKAIKSRKMATQDHYSYEDASARKGPHCTMVWKWLNLRQNLKIDNNDYNEYNSKEMKFKRLFFFIFWVFICNKVIFNNSR